MNFFDMSEVQKITGYHIMPGGIQPAPPDLQHQIVDHHMYQRLDQALLSLVGHSYTWPETLKTVRDIDSHAYDYVVTYWCNLARPLYALS
jgi:hypothetical protein